MQLLYTYFYRQYGIRRVQSLFMPRTFEINSLPRNSMLHILTHDVQHPDIDTSKLYFGNNTRKILVDYPENLLEEKGSPRKKAVLIKNMFRIFHFKNKNFRYLKDHYLLIKDELTLLINNYNYLDVAYRYVDLPMTQYFKWWNNEVTLWGTINDLANKTDRNHFVFIDAAKELPAYSLLKTYETRTNISMLKIFDNKDKLFVLEMFKWLNTETREQSIFKKLEAKNYNKVNLAFTTESNKTTIVNLGYLNSWIKGSDNTTEFTNVSQFNSLQIQKIFLKFLISLQSLEMENVEQIETVDTVSDTPAHQDTEDDSEDKDLLEERNEYLNDHSPDEDEINSSYTENNSVYLNKNSDNKPLEIVKTDDKLLDKAVELDLDINSQLADIDDDLKALEKINKSNLKQKGLHVDKDGNITEDAIEEDVPIEHISNLVYENKDYEQVLIKKINEAADYGLLSASDYKKFLNDVQQYKTMTDPYGSNTKVIDKMIVTKQDVAVDDVKSAIVSSDIVIDKTMNNSSLLSFDHDYITKILQKDVLAMVNSLQKAGVVVKKHEMELDSSALGEYENHTLELKPIDGVSSRIHFRIPRIAEDGTMVVNGNKYVIRKQRVDLPIRKIKPNVVALSSYYGKTFVSTGVKKADNSIEWIYKQINKAIAEDSKHITKVGPADVYDNNFKAPFIYNALAHKFKTIKVGNLNLVFDHSDRDVLTNGEDLSKLESNEKIVCGFTDKLNPIVVDKSNQFFAYVKNEYIPLGDIYTVLQLDLSAAPVDFSEVKIFSKPVPVGIALSYFIGFKNLLKLLDVKYRVVEGRKNKNLESHEYAVTFRDCSYVFSRKDKLSSLIIGGFTDYEKQTKQYDLNEFNNKDVYLNLLATKGLSSIYIRELEMYDQLFVDSITKNILEEMNEPTTYRGLLIRSTEMLLNYNHPDTQDMDAMRIRGYERIAGAVYKELSQAIRQYRSKNIAGRSKIDISPYQVWSSIMKDPSVKLVEDINPIQNLKESEVVTYAGEGGRGKDSMNKESRAYHVNDMGIVSEATVDSADVGINAYLSANPNFKDLRGLVKTDKSFNASNIISTAALLAPGSDRDDSKRVNFVSIQQSHTIAADGYHQPYIRTGYEYVIANRTTDMFAYTAKQDGKIISKTDKGVIVEYKDGTRKGINLGRVYGKAEGSIYPHDIISELNENDKVNKGDIIAYNTGFFEKDFLDKTKVVLKNSLNAKVALYESNQTFEDSSSICGELSRKLTAKTTKVKSLTVDFKQNLHNVVKPGQNVEPKDILLVIEDEITSSGSFDEESLSILKKLSNQSPRAKYQGTVDKIEVYYHGNKEDMSNSLKALADRSDRILSDSCKASNKPVITGQVNDEYRVSGVPLTLDKAEIKIYITIQTQVGVGDKLVFANQMKSVVGEVMDYDMHTESGQRLDAVFGFRSIVARIVTSPVVIGTTTTLLRKVAENAVKLYRS